MQAKDVAKGYMLLQQLIHEGALTHDGDPRWLDALGVVEEREISGMGRAVKRVRGEGCPLVAATFAILALDKTGLQEVVPMPRRGGFAPVAVPSAGGGRADFDF